jgi:hypothetical protein
VGELHDLHLAVVAARVGVEGDALEVVAPDEKLHLRTVPVLGVVRIFGLRRARQQVVGHPVEALDAVVQLQQLEVRGRQRHLGARHELGDGQGLPWAIKVSESFALRRARASFGTPNP